MGREQHSGARGKWYYPKEHTSDNANRLVDLCEQAGLIVAFAFKRTLCDVAFCSDQRPVQEFRERNRGVPLQPKIDMAGLEDEEL
ncbi:hypothetical protein RB195_024672 [Necator americanus]|uniref:Uncharacterized protein n=1 Tax=Necator americanus TaxID=51031 RepID=A0ABR1EP83_NECAM